MRDVYSAYSRFNISLQLKVYPRKTLELMNFCTMVFAFFLTGIALLSEIIAHHQVHIFLGVKRTGSGISVVHLSIGQQRPQRSFAVGRSVLFWETFLYRIY